jgi:putative intracellular protease/amidase
VPGRYLTIAILNDQIDPLVQRLEKAQKPVAASCAATTALERTGLLKGRKHTSNSLSYLSK